MRLAFVGFAPIVRVAMDPPIILPMKDLKDVIFCGDHVGLGLKAKSTVRVALSFSLLKHFENSRRRKEKIRKKSLNN